MSKTVKILHQRSCSTVRLPIKEFRFRRFISVSRLSRAKITRSGILTRPDKCPRNLPIRGHDDRFGVGRSESQGRRNGRWWQGKTKQAAVANAFCEWPLFVSPFLSQKQSSSQIFSLDRSVVILRPSNAKTARYSRRCLQWLYVLYL